jgi:DNA polymerase (family X)
MENREIAKIFRETAHLLEIDGAIIGRYRSYEKAADLIDSIPDRIEDLAKDVKKLTALPGIGQGMAEHIDEVLKTGDYSLRQKLLKKYPSTILDLLALQSLGPKKIAFLWKKFKCCSVADVAKLAQEGKLRELEGFGEKSEQNILKAVETHKRSSGRFLISTADAAAQALREHILSAGEAVEEVTPAGSLRRGKETIGDLDLLVTMRPGHDKPKNVEAVAHHILKFPGIVQKLAHGENKVSFLLSNNLQVDVRLLDKKCFGAALLYFTGSKEHNVRLRGLANDVGWTLNEYALTEIQGGKVIAGKTEEEIYAKLKLKYVPPELRENTGEIEAAETGKIPQLIELSDIRGDLHMHTVASDGRATIEEMASAAKARGYQYIALTDHSKAVTVANGLDEKRALQQIAKIHAAQKRISGIRLLTGMEVDILKDGSLDLDDEVLAQLDVVIASVHSYMNLDKAAMTDRILAAIENPYTQVIAHPTGRKVLTRDPFDFDMQKILAATKRNGVIMECNSHPDRLDLKDANLRAARDSGVKIIINTDSHATSHLQLIKYGVTTARRGWLEKKDVVNTLPLEAFQAALRPKPQSKSTAKRKSA